ncbi:MAG: biotin/lipoyl-binding protein [Chlorobi bacterium]|nr:biotin/lipoyl-binding protein [Chlorobiota bacterium]
MSLEIKTKDRTAAIEVLEQEGSFYKVKIDDKVYELDVEKVKDGVYSIIHNGASVNMEAVEGDSPNKLNINTENETYEVEVIDAASRYKAASGGGAEASDRTISSPMPGKVVKIPVSEGDKVSKGETVIIISAMKMESEYKSAFDGTVAKIFVKEGDTTEASAPLVEIEPAE